MLLCCFVVPVSREDVESTDRSNVNVFGALEDWGIAKSCQQGLKVVRCNAGCNVLISGAICGCFVNAHLRIAKMCGLKREEDWG